MFCRRFPRSLILHTTWMCEEIEGHGSIDSSWNGDHYERQHDLSEDTSADELVDPNAKNGGGSDGDEL
jgi:hypothetical protein